MDKGFSEISTVFDCDEESSHRILYSSSVRNTLAKLLPADFFLFSDASECSVEVFSKLIPAIKWVEWGEDGLQLSVYMLCRQKSNGVKFFYDMISKWLMPGRRLNVSSFFATDFKLPGLSDEQFTVCEMVISFKSSADMELARNQMPILESEMRMGLLSIYHASRILEIKGLSADEKTSLIHKQIASLLKKRPKDFDYAIFAQMQHFLVMCKEEFKAVRSYAHMSRIIYVFYLFRKALKAQIEQSPSQRFVHVKVSRAYLRHPFGLKKVLGIFAGLNFQGDNELFEERHFVSVFHARFPHLKVVEESFFFSSSKEERTQVLYLEVEKADGMDFALSEIKWIKEKLPTEILSGIEKLARSLFMPRNEEEVMRNIITLSHQLKLARDLPQVIINFESQIEAELVFTVIWLRVRNVSDLPIESLFERSSTFLRFIPDRIKHVGFLRKKSPKEATVFRLKMPAQKFLRSDHSVDLFKARQSIVEELLRLLGEFRDYNGGMIAKQHEQFTALKRLLGPNNDELLLENFFHSIFPIELRSVFNPLFLKNLFLMLVEAVQKREGSDSDMYKASATGCAYFLLAYRDDCLRERVIDCIKVLEIPSSQLLSISLEHLGVSYLGYIYFEEDGELCNRFFDQLFEIDLVGKT